jgi:predicted DNA-binding ribbon-helix-helix protein
VMMARKPDGEKPKAPPKRSLVVAGKKTSVSLEDTLWNELRAMAEERNVSVSELVDGIELKRKPGGLASAIRSFLSSRRKRR